MPQPTGKFIDRDENGKSDTGAGAGFSAADPAATGSTSSAGGDFIRGNPEPEGPDTVKLNPAGPTVGPRRNRDGRIDGRTRAARGGGDTAPTPTAKGPLNLEKLSVKELLLDIHAMAAAFLKIEEFDLSEEEGKRYSERIEELLRLYPNNVVNPKAVAWCALLATAGGIYSTRYAAYKLRMENEKSNPAPPPVQRTATPQTQPIQGAQPLNGKAASHPEASFLTPSQFWPEGAEV